MLPYFNDMEKINGVKRLYVAVDELGEIVNIVPF